MCTLLILNDCVFYIYVNGFKTPFSLLCSSSFVFSVSYVLALTTVELKKCVILFCRNKREENRHNLKQLQKKQSPLKRKSQLLAQKNFSTDSSSDNDSNLRRKQVTLFLRHQSWQMMTFVKVG
jgi:hypothetical protein